MPTRSRWPPTRPPARLPRALAGTRSGAASTCWGLCELSESPQDKRLVFFSYLYVNNALL